MKKYSLTPEHRMQLGPWADKWVAHALSTDPVDPERIRKAVLGLYAAADLAEPRVVVVPSPFVAVFAYGAAAAISGKVTAATDAAIEGATRAAATAATEAATRAAAEAATRVATEAATRAATTAAARAATAATWAATAATAATEAADAAAIRAAAAATRGATQAATRTTTEAAIEAATRGATEAAARGATAATWDATRAAARAVDAATQAAVAVGTTAAIRAAMGASTWYNAGGCAEAALAIAGPEGLNIANEAWRARNSGNQWPGYSAYLSFFRHVAKLDIDYSKWQYYEELAECSGPRYMHAEFCIVSDRPKTLLVDDDNEPHCEDGPFCQWRDGTRLYAIHGHYVPEWIIEHPELITLDKIKAEDNAETRRIMRERYGDGRYLTETGAKVLDMDTVPVDALEPRGGQITRALMEDDEGARYLVGSDGSTTRVYYMLVSRTCTSCEEAYRELRGTPETFRTILQS